MPLMSPLRVLGSYLKEHLLIIFSGVTNFKFELIFRTKNIRKLTSLSGRISGSTYSKSHMRNTCLEHASGSIVLMLASVGYL